MNKLIRKIAIGLVGASMAIGLGVAVSRTTSFKDASAKAVQVTDQTITIASIVSANHLVDQEASTTIALNEYVSLTTAGTGNNGKYYSSNQSWRLYENGNGLLTVQGASGVEFSKITFTYEKKENGALYKGQTTYSSGTAINISGNSYTFDGVKHTSGTKSSNIQITAIKLSYSYDDGTGDATLTSVAITGDMTKKTYLVGESWNYSGLSITGTYSNDAQLVLGTVPELIASGDLEVEANPAAPAQGNTQITLEGLYGENIMEVPSKTITGLTVKTVTGVAITGDMTKKSYINGDEWNYAGLSMTVSYNAGDPDVVPLADAVTAGSIVFDADPATAQAGGTSMTIKNVMHSIYEGDIANKQITGLSVRVAPSQISYDLSTNTTLAATASEMSWANNFSTMRVDKGTSDVDANNYYPGKQGQSYTSTRLYSGHVLTIAPKAGVEITKVEFTATTENYATALNGSSWNNASSSVNAKLVTVTPTDGMNSISATVGGTTGLTNIKLYYYAKELSSVSFSGTAVTPQYVGDDFDPTGLTFTAHFNDESTASINANQISWNPLQAGQNPTGTYNGKTVTITGVTVLVNALQSIAISGEMTKTAYKANGTWDPTGLVVTATFAKEAIEVTEDVEWSFVPAKPAADTKTVVVTATYTSNEVERTASTSPISITIQETEGLLKSGYYYITAKDTSTYYFPQGEFTAGNATNNPGAEAYSSTVYGKAYYFNLVSDNTYTISYVNGSSETCYLNVANDNNGAKVTAMAEPTSACNWTLTASGKGFNLSASDGSNTRYLALYSQQDWRTYKTDSGVRLLNIVAENDKFATDFIESYTGSCNATTGTYTSLDWATATSHYNALHSKTEFEEATYTKTGVGANTVVTPGDGVREKVANAVAKYDYIVSKYGKAQFADFMNRDPQVQLSYNVFKTVSMNDSGLFTVVAILSVSSLAFGAILFSKKRKHN